MGKMTMDMSDIDINAIREKLIASGITETHVAGSILQFTELFPPDVFDRTLKQIQETLQEFGCSDPQKIQKLAEYLFAEIFIGAPSISPAAI